jgi:hypothetical protein
MPNSGSVRAAAMYYVAIDKALALFYHSLLHRGASPRYRD